MKVLYFNGPPDFMQAMIIEGLNELHRCKGIELRVLNNVILDDVDTDGLNHIGEEAMLFSVEWADFIIFDAASGYEWMTPEVSKLFNNTAIRNKKIVFIDGTDNFGWFDNPHDFLCYFKREVRQPTWMFQPQPLVRSLSFSMLKKFQPHQPDANNYIGEFQRREIDVSFVATNSNGIRLQFAQFLQSMAKANPSLKFVIDVRSGRVPMVKEEYFNILRHSKIAISCPGVGFDTKRFWEIPGCGAVLASYDITYRTLIRDIFEHNRHAIYFDSFQQAHQLINTVIGNPAIWCMMRQSTDLWSYRHTTEFRAKQLVGMSMECKSFVSSRGMQKEV